jgi:hypothetical protein
VEAVYERPQDPPARGIVLLLGVSVLVNAALVAVLVLVVAGGGAREWTAGKLGLATSGDVETAVAQALAADAKATEAFERARRALPATDVSQIRARASTFGIELSALRTRVAAAESKLAAACDWARLQEANAEPGGFSNAFFDFGQTVCSG